jgi:hypothetical protein
LSSFKLAADLAISKPTPLLAPVINHTLFFSMIIVLFWFSQNYRLIFFADGGFSKMAATFEA